MGKGILNFIGRDAGFGFHNNAAFYTNKNRLILLDCGMTVFNDLREKVDLKEYDIIDIIITHLHPDHAGSLGQLIMYLWYKLNKKANVYCNCENIIKFLDIIGVDKNIYLLSSDNNIRFIKTKHVPELDAYGVVINVDNKKIIYTGDTATLEPFIEEMKDADELYVDVSKSGGVHIKIDEVLNQLLKFKKLGGSVYLMHIDDFEYVNKITNGQFYME